jgi:hypothetical protein
MASTETALNEKRHRSCLTVKRAMHVPPLASLTAFS